MDIYNSQQWIKDINTVLEIIPELSELDGKTIMITGATGLICSSIVDILFQYNENHDIPIQVVVAGRSEEKMEFRFAEYSKMPYYKFVAYNAGGKNNNLQLPCDYIIHGASNASPDRIMKEPVETMCSNFMGLLDLLRYAECCGIKRVLYISSSEVYGKRKDNKPYGEDEYGYVDLLNPRNSYSMGKRAAETLCASYAKEYGVESVIVRPGHVYGPTASQHDTRVSSIWAYQAACRKNLIMKSDGSQLRSYCYCLDCATAILKVLLRGKSGFAYNISNPDSIMSIKEMGQLLARIAGVKLIQKEDAMQDRKGFNPMDNSSLNGTQLFKLGWRPMFDANRGFSHTVCILKEMKKKDKICKNILKEAPLG